MSIFPTFFTHGSVDAVPKQYQAEFLQELTFTNIRRIRAMLLFGVIGCVVLVVAVNILNILHLQPAENRIVLTMHLVLLGILLCLAAPVFMRPVRSVQDLTHFHDVLLKTFFAVIPFAPQTLIHAIIITKGHPIFLFMGILIWYSSLLQPPRLTVAVVMPLLIGLWLQLILFTPISDGGQFIGESFLFSLTVSAVVVIAGGLRFRSTAESFAQRKAIEEERNRVAQLNAELHTAYRETEMMNQELLNRQEILEEQATEIEIINTQLHEQNEVLIALHEEKSELLAIVSHDLKNPIAAVRGLAAILQTEMIEPKQVTEIIGHIATNADRMLDLVKNLLDVHRLELGGWSFEAEVFDVVPIAQAVLKEYVIAAQAKNIQVHFSTDLPEYSIVADKQAVTQVLDNLLSNAIKYSPMGKNVFVKIQKSHSLLAIGREDGHSTLAISHLLSDDNSQPMTNQPMTNDQWLRIEIQDEGPGISPEDMKKLFGKFARLSARPTGGEHSTGLGLSIVKKMVEAMNGKVWCESELGAGSTFYVELPCPRKPM